MKRLTLKDLKANKRLLVAGIIVLTVSATAVIVAVRRSGQVSQARATYYCPMHPGIVKNRPGECPICYMRLVKREEEPAATPTQQQAAQRKKDICYMHNCPMVKKGRQCPMLVVAKEGESVTCPVCGTHVADAAVTPQSAQTARGPKKILYWTDPMIPGYTSGTPGTSPMGMELIPVYEEAAGPVTAQPTPLGYAPVMVSPQKQQLIGVKTAPVETRPLTKTIRAVGTIAHDPELYQTQQEFIQAQQTLRQAEASRMPVVMERAKRLVESTRLRLRHLGLSESMIEEFGASTEPDHRLLLGGEGQYWVYASVYEYELPLVREGQTVALEVSGLPGQTFPGTVKAIDPILDHMTRTARVRILGEDPHGVLRPGMYVNTSLEVNLGEVLMVPSEAVFATGTENIVFIDRGHGVFEPRNVVVGTEADGATEVKEGLTEGERVVTSGNFLIDSESRLKAALQGMTPPPGSSPEASRRLDDVGGPSDRETGGGVSHEGHAHGH